jgi:hypothetical protein
MMRAPAHPLRLLAVVLVCVSVLVGGALIWMGNRQSDQAEVVAGTPRSGWKTIEYDAVQIDVPASWERLDVQGCEFHFETWAPPGSTGCDVSGGVAFYGSATFDPASRPGVRRVRADGEPAWAGYVYAGDLAVYASDDDRDTVRRVLRSAGPR